MRLDLSSLENALAQLEEGLVLYDSTLCGNTRKFGAT